MADYKNRYQLKWATSRDSLPSLLSVANHEKDFSNMLDWVKNAIEQYPRFTNIIKFGLLIIDWSKAGRTNRVV